MSIIANKKRRNAKLILLGFIVVSLGLHLFFGGGTIISERWSKYRAEQRVLAEKRQAEEVRAQAKKAAEQAKLQAVKKDAAEVRQAAVEQLHEQFKTAVGDDLKKNAADKLWNKILAKLTSGLDDYTKAATNPSATDAQLTEELNKLQANVLEDASAQVREATKRELADSFVQSVEDNVSGKLADYYRREISKRIGTGLHNESTKIVKEETAGIQGNRKDVSAALDDAEKNAKNAANELTLAQKRLDAAAKGDPNGHASAIKAEQTTIDRAKKSLADAESTLKSVGNKSNDLGTASRKAFDHAKGAAVDEFKKGLESANNSAATGNLKEFTKATGDAATAAGKLSSALREAKTSAARDNADGKSDASVMARTALKDARDEQIKGNINKAFDENVQGRAVGRISSKLTEAFKGALTDAKVPADDKTVAEVEKRVREALSNRLKKDLDAGVAATDQLTKSQHLDDLPPSGVASAGSDPTDNSSASASATQPGGKARSSAIGKNLGDQATTQLAALGKNDTGMDAADDGTSATDGTKTGEAASGKNSGKKTKHAGQASGSSAAPSTGESSDDSGDADADGGNEGTSKGGKHRRSAHAQAVADRSVKAAKTLTDAGLESLANDEGGDKSLVSAATSGTKGKGHSKSSGTSSGDAGDAAGASGAAGDEQSADDGLANASLGDRLSKLADGIRSGRSSLVAAAGGSPSDGGGGSASAGGGQGGPAGGGPAAQANKIEGQTPGRSSSVHLLRSGEAVYHAEEYNKLVGDISTRDRAAAQGTAIQRTGAAGSTPPDQAPIGDPSTERLAITPLTTLVPPPSTNPAGEADPSKPFKPSFNTIAFAVIPFRQKDIVLDGDLSEWENMPAISMSPQGGGKDPSLRRTNQTTKACWDNTGLYFAYDVTDADDKITKVRPENFWEGDGVEVFVDGRNVKLKTRTEDVQQFWAWVDGSATDPAQVGGEVTGQAKDKKYVPVDKSRMQVASRKTDHGWTIELHIPIERFKNLELAPGRIIGFNLSIGTGTPVYYYFAGNGSVETSLHPDTWGDALLAGSEGKLQYVEKLVTELVAEGKPTETGKALNVHRIGQPLRLRVTDPDMNLSDKVRDSVEVDIATSRGQRCRLILSETGEKTGVFEGAIRTMPDIGEIPGTDAARMGLTLLEGEKVTVRYTDQCRPDGARNIELKLVVPTAAAVANLVVSK